MAGKPEWKKVLQDPKAFVWIAFLLLVIGIGVVTLMFGGPRAAVNDHAQAPQGSSSARLK